MEVIKIFVKFYNYISYTLSRYLRANEVVKYKDVPLTLVTKNRLNSLKRKILVLDLDETLIHSHHDALTKQTVPPGTPCDFTLSVKVDRHLIKFYIHKRPYVDYFLDIVSQWYDLVVFTASLKVYGCAIADHLDNGKNIWLKRFYRHHCTQENGSFTKNLNVVSNDLKRVFIIDNSPAAYRNFRSNALPISSWYYDPLDQSLLQLLPVLDALRFTYDVRTILSRNIIDV